MARAKEVVLASPEGIAVFPKLNEPDYAFNPGGVWSSKLKYSFDDEDAQKLWDFLEAEHKAAYLEFIDEQVEAGKYKTKALALKKIPEADKPHNIVEDDDGEDTNEFTVNFKRPYHVVVKATQKEYYFTPLFYDASNTKLKNVPQIWGGSSLKVTYNCNHWGTVKLGGGISLRLKNVQIINLVNAENGGDSGPSGFGEEEGYSGEDFDSGVATSAPASADGDPGATDDGTGDF